MKPIRVLIVEDSAVMRKFLRDVLSSTSEIEVVGAAHDPYIARDMIKRLDPDVLTLDINMPKMDGLEFLERLMRLRPLPVVMFSGLTQEGSGAAVQALTMGAVDFVAKPTTGDISVWNNVASELIDKVRAAANAHLQLLMEDARPDKTDEKPSEPWPLNRLVAIGASTGGVQALRQILGELPEICPPIVVAQHMPANFTASFAKRLNTQCRVTVSEAQDGAEIAPGNVYFAPGDKNLTVEFRRSSYICRIESGGGAQTPSIDQLLQSVAATAGPAAMGVILTGMGRDGAAGLSAIKAAGGSTAAQDRETSLIYGMPKAAVELGGAMYELPLDRIGSFLLSTPRSRGAPRVEGSLRHAAR